MSKYKRNKTHYIQRRDPVDRLQKMLSFANVKWTIKELYNENLESVCNLSIKLHYKLVSILDREDIC